MTESFASFWLSRMAIAALVIYISSAIRLWRLAPKARTNRLAALLCADLAVWALQAAISYAADDPAVTVALSRAMSWSWTFFPAIALHFALELCFGGRSPSPRVRRAVIAAVYSAALSLAWLLAGPLLRGAVRRAGYWSVDILPSPGYSAFAAYYLGVNLLGMFLIARRWLRAKAGRERTMLGLIVVTHAIALAGGFTTDTVLEALGVDFPKVGVLWACVWAVGLNVAMERYGFLAPFSPRDTGLLMDRFVERSMDGIAVADDVGRVIYWNAPLAELTGIPVEEALGEPLRLLQRTVAPEGAPEDGIADLVFRAARDQSDTYPRPVEFEIRRRDGAPRWLQASAFAIPGDDGEIWAFITRDVTRERLAAEESLERLRRQAHAQKMEALGSLAGGIAHDFNNTLGGIVGAVSLIQSRLDAAGASAPVDIARELEIIQRSTKRAASSVRGLMAFTTHAPERHEPFSLSDSVLRVVELSRRTMNRTVAIVVGDLPPDAAVTGDPSQVEQLILNLVINAEQATTTMRPIGEARGGSVELDLRRVDPESLRAVPPDVGRAAYWALSVRDDGVGIDAAVLPRVFDPFYTTKDADHGSGLGLSMVHLIAKQHGGYVEAVSEPGAGSTFTVYLPTAPASALRSSCMCLPG